jgi:DNA-binding ferritin-like protein
MDGKRDFVRHCLEMLNTVKLYHWFTHSYPEHKATDELYSNINDHMDKFVEVLLGKDGSRINQIERTSYLIPDPQNTNEIKKKVEDFKNFLINLPLHDARDTDLANIRDEILADMNQFLYLLTLS